MLIVRFFIDRCCQRQQNKSHISPSIEKIVARFQKWMSEYDHSNSQMIKTLEWLSADLGYKHVSNYQCFKAFVKVVQGPSPIPTEEEFWKAYDAARKDHLGLVEEASFQPKVDLQEIGGI
mgnify:CR=1 FL=1